MSIVQRYLEVVFRIECSGVMYCCRLDTAVGKTEPKLFRQTKLKGGYAPAQEFETKQEFAVSKDGTRVPMFITHKKGTPLDGSAPTLLYGYGGTASVGVRRCALGLYKFA